MPERAAELVKPADSGVPKSVIASDHGISRETVHQHLKPTWRDVLPH